MGLTTYQLVQDFFHQQYLTNIFLQSRWFPGYLLVMPCQISFWTLLAPCNDKLFHVFTTATDASLFTDLFNVNANCAPTPWLDPTGKSNWSDQQCLVALSSWRRRPWVRFFVLWNHDVAKKKWTSTSTCILVVRGSFFLTQHPEITIWKHDFS